MSAAPAGRGHRGLLQDDAAAGRARTVRPRRGPALWPTSARFPNPRKLEGRGDPLSTVRFLDAQGPVVEVRAERGAVSGYLGGRMRIKDVEYFTFGKERFYEFGAGSMPPVKGFVKDGVDVERLRPRIEAMLGQGRSGGPPLQRASRGPSPERIGGRAVERRSTLRGEALDRELLMSCAAAADDMEYIDVPEVDLHEHELQEIFALRRQCSDVGGGRRKEVLLPSLPIFASCSARFAQALQRSVRKVLLHQGQCIATAGNPSERRMYAVAGGRLEVSRGGVLVRALVNEGTFGEANLVGMFTKWECDVEASGPTMLYEVTADAMKSAVEESPGDARRFPWLGDEGFELGKLRSEAHRWRAFRRCTPLKGCSEMLLRALDAVTEVTVHFPGEELVREGSPNSELVLVEAGEAQFELAGRAVRSEVVPSQRVIIAEVAGSPMHAPDPAAPPSPRKPAGGTSPRANTDRAARATVGALPMSARRRKQEELWDLAPQEPEAIVVGDMNLLRVSTHSSAALRAVTACLVRRLSRDRFMDVLSRYPGDWNNLRPFLRLQHAEIYPPLEVRHVGLLRDAFSRFAEFGRFLLAHVEERIFCAGQRVTLDDQHKNISGSMPKNLSFCRLNRGSIQVFPDHSVRALRGEASKDPPEEITEGEIIFGDVFCGTKLLQARETCYVSVLHRGVIARAFEELPEERAELLDTVAGEGTRTPKNVKILRDRCIFSGASPEFIKTLEAKAQVRVYMPGDRIIRQTDEGKAVYILWVGSASIVQETEGVVDGRRTRSIAHLGTLVHGAVFGELAMLAQRHLHGVIASTVCCMWEVSFPMVREVLQGHPAERAAFLHMVEQHLDKLGNQQVGDCPLFADFSQHFRTFIGVNSEKHLYFAGQTIVQEGAFGDRFVIVNFGTARVEAMGQRLPEPRRGGARAGYGMLCRSSSFTKEKYHVSVTAETMCQVFVVTRDAFQAALKKYPDMRDAARTLEAKEAHEERLQRDQANLLMKQHSQRSRHLHSFMQALSRLFDYSLGEESSAKRRVTQLYFDAFRRVVSKIVEDRAVAERTRQAGLQQIERWISRRREQLEQAKQQQAMKTLVSQNLSQRGPLALPKSDSQKRPQSRQLLSQSWEGTRSPYLSPNPQWKQAPAATERVALPSLPLFSPSSTLSPRGSISARPSTAPAQDVAQPVPSGGHYGPTKPASARGAPRRRHPQGPLQDAAPSPL